MQRNLPESSAQYHYYLEYPFLAGGTRSLHTTNYSVQDSDLKYLSLITSAHINLPGLHYLDLQASKNGTGNCVPCGRSCGCSKEAKKRLSVVNFSTFLRIAGQKVTIVQRYSQ